MKQCPLCRRSYTDEYLNFCLDDGASLRPLSVHATAEPADAKTVPNAATLVLPSDSGHAPYRTFSHDPTIVQTEGELSREVLPPSPPRQVPFLAYPAAALAIVILAGGVLWWKYAPSGAGAEPAPAIKVGNELRDEFRRAREKLDETGVADFERAEEKLALLRSIDGDNGRAWYFAGEIKRVKDTAHFDSISCARSPMEAAFDPAPYQQDFYRYLELAARNAAPDDSDMSAEVCYSRPDGVCLQRTAWIEHLLAVDMYRAAVAATTPADRAAKLGRAANHVKEALKYRPPQGGQGFGQCVDTLALEQLIKDASARE